MSAAAILFVQRHGWTLYYGDAEAHLNIARRILDSRTPGYSQIGTVWLPLPHILMLPFIGSGWLWRNGLAGAIPAAACFIGGGTFLFAAARRIFGSGWAALASTAVYATNPNVLYLQATPMTEPALFCELFAALYFCVAYRSRPTSRLAAGAGLSVLAATLTRYEGWFLIPFVAALLWFSGGASRIGAVALFCFISCLGPLYWLAHNRILFGDAFDFYNGSYSAQGIYHAALAAGGKPYPGDHDWPKALLYFRTAAALCAGAGTLALGLVGTAVALRRRAFMPVFLLLLPPAFYVLSLHGSGTPIFVPTLWPHSYYNTRYGLAALPLLAFGAGALVPLASRRFQYAAALVVITLALIRSGDVITWKESEVNSAERRAWTQDAARYLAPQYLSGTGIFTSFGDLTAIYREAAIPLRETLHEGNGPAALAARYIPGLLQEEWAIGFANDPVTQAARRTGRYRLLHKSASVEIYRRDGHEYSLH